MIAGDDVRRFVRSYKWLDLMMGELRRKKRGKYVAVVNCRIVGESDTKEDLLKYLWIKGYFPGPVVVAKVD